MTRTTRGNGRPLKIAGSKLKVESAPSTFNLQPSTTLTLSVPLDANGAIPTHALITALLTLCHYAANDRAITAILSDALSLHTMRKDTSRPATNGVAK